MIRLLIVEGADKVGKTTLINDLQKPNLLNEDINIHVFNDLQNENYKFIKWFKDYIRSGDVGELNYLTQGLLFASASTCDSLNFKKFEQQIESALKSNEKHLIILDRSAISTIIYTMASYLSQYVILNENDFLGDDGYRVEYLDINKQRLIHALLSDKELKYNISVLKLLRKLFVGYYNHKGKKTFIPSLIFIKNESLRVQLERLDETKDFYEDKNKQLIVQYLYSCYIKGNLVDEEQLVVPDPSSRFCELINNRFVYVNKYDCGLIYESTLAHTKEFSSNLKSFKLATPCVYQKAQDPVVAFKLVELINDPKFWQNEKFFKRVEYSFKDE